MYVYRLTFTAPLIFFRSLALFLENSVLEINHVTNVTTVLNETTSSDRVSRSKVNLKDWTA